MRIAAVVLALGAGSMNAKPAQADGGAIIAGVAGGLILGTIIGSSSHANTYYAPGYTYRAKPRRHYYPAPTYHAPRYRSGANVTFSFGSGYGNHGYYGGHRAYRHRGHGYRHHRGHRPMRRHYRRHHGYR